MHVANVIDVYASRDTPFALIFRTYPADPFTPFLSAYYGSLYFQREPTVSRWKTETWREVGEKGEHRLLNVYVAVCYAFPSYGVLAKRTELILLLYDRTGRTMKEREIAFFLPFPPRSHVYVILDTRDRGFFPSVRLQLIRFFIQGCRAPDIGG